MRFGVFKIGKAKEKPDRDTIETEDAPADRIADHKKNRAKSLKEAEQQLIELTETVNVSEKLEDVPKPHGPLVELTIEPEEELVSEEKDEPVEAKKVAGTPVGKAEEKVVIAKAAAPAKAATESSAPAKAAAPAEAAAKAEDKKTTATAEKDDLNDLFSQEDDEVNPLANLINSLPDVTAQELIDDLQEIKEIILEAQKK